MLAVSLAALQGLAARPVDVAIIGGGPCGLATALALSKSRCLQGIPSVRTTACGRVFALCVHMDTDMGTWAWAWIWRWGHGHGNCMAWHGSALHAHCMLTACALTHVHSHMITAWALHGHCMCLLRPGRVEVFESDAFGPKGASIQISKCGSPQPLQPNRHARLQPHVSRLSLYLQVRLGGTQSH